MRKGIDPGLQYSRNRKFERLVEWYQEPILRTCFLYLCDKTLAEDAVQETFVRVYRSLESFRGDSSEKTWITKIAMRVCYDLNHSNWYRLMNRYITPDMLPDSPTGAATEEDEELTLAVMKLPRTLREVILLYYYQGFKVEEIAEILHIAHSSVSGRLKRARTKLKCLLEGREIDE